MPEIGQTIRHYKILEKLGAGGMGEVFRARDTQLNRDVALKALPADFAADPDRLVRFQREAQVLASFNHPHIAQIYGLADAEGVRALVMELVEGPPLADRIARGPMPIDEALPLAQQLAEALEYAHERGIVHRDLKPANVKITPEGAVKVLDFGLAKAFEGSPSGVDLSHSPTLTSPMMTRAGVILGTAAYMSPEQARGAVVDKRADIWSFGVVLFEMLTGRACFTGESVTDVLAAVVRAEPDWAALPGGTPWRIVDLLHRCLQKDRKRRLHDIADARIDIEAALASPAEPCDGAVAPVPSTAAKNLWPRRRALALTAAALLVGVIVTALSLWRSHSARINTGTRITHLDMRVVPADELNAGGANPAYLVENPGGSRTALAWTPDGHALVFVGRRGGVQQLYLRALDQQEAHSLPGTEGAQVPTMSVDGDSVAFWAYGAIKKVTISTGLVEPMVPNIPLPFGMSWSDAGLLIGSGRSSTGSGCVYLFTQGSELKPITTPQEGEIQHVLPQWLPGNTAFLYTAKKRLYSWGDERLYAHSLKTGERKLLMRNAVDARYVPDHIVFLREKRLYASAFDASRIELRGDPIIILDNVAQALANTAASDSTGAGQFSMSNRGDLAYVEDTQKPWPDNVQLVKVDRRGKVTLLPTPSGNYGRCVRANPLDYRIADAVQELTTRSIWVFDLLGRGKTIAKLGGEGEVGTDRIWSLDGKRITFDWLNPRGIREIVSQVADGSTPPQKLAEDGTPYAWTPNGELLGLKGGHVWMLADSTGRGVQRQIVQTPGAVERWPTVSRDGRWLAYGSDELKSFNVYVQPYPGPGSRQIISTDGGECPLWNPAGDELFLLTHPDKAGERQMMAVPLPVGADGRHGTPQRLFSFKDTDLHFYASSGVGYDVARDGMSFYTTQAIPTPPPPPVTHIHIVLNWFEEVKAKVSKGK